MTAAAVIAQRFRFRLAPGYPVEPIAWTNLHPKGGIWMTVEALPEWIIHPSGIHPAKSGLE